ncbi:2OG-Fe dioxygenase family protein [Streptomyces gardneri]|uniref:2OG-Fe dioxygenase family protein n=1 Tax=Streptomyces gardneri TaxID=66892 RepID=UPI00099EBBBE|nr:2OG-Fe dioxygenase family protein [Streptomyces gardneri]WRK41703.1 2OG-Fe dioxygenase family protein [Streptomyces venezuelae]
MRASAQAWTGQAPDFCLRSSTPAGLWCLTWGDARRLECNGTDAGQGRSRRDRPYAAADGPLLAATTFRLPLDSLYAEDARVLHDVTPVSVAVPAASGHRDMLLMSFKAGEGTG